MPEPVPAYIGLGSNLSDPIAQLRAALAALGRLPSSRLVAVSRMYRNPPMGPADQPDYVNAVARLDTELSPRALLEALLGIEQAQGRVRDGERWGPRTLDLDLLVYGRSRLEEPGLTVPHPGLPARGFVLYPLREIAPELDVPGMGPVAALCAQCPDDGLIPLD